MKLCELCSGLATPVTRRAAERLQVEEDSTQAEVEREGDKVASEVEKLHSIRRRLCRT